MTSVEYERARGCLAGLAVGDALGRPVEGMEPEHIAERWGRVEGYVAETPLGSDDTEYALLTALALVELGDNFSAERIAAFWKTKVCDQVGGFNGGGFSEMLAIKNIARGLKPPRSGQHSHGWSDGLAMRVAPIGIVSAGDPKRAAKLAHEDGIVSHSGEGIYGGQAVAAAVAQAMTGASAVEAFEAAVAAVPADSWTGRSLRIAEQLCERHHDWLDLATNAVRTLAVRDYYWADLAPEAVALTFVAVLGGDGEFDTTVLNAVNLGRDADTIAAMAGAIAGARLGYRAIREEWLPAVAVAPGVCLSVTAGVDPMLIADQLVDMSSKGKTL